MQTLETSRKTPKSKRHCVSVVLQIIVICCVARDAGPSSIADAASPIGRNVVLIVPAAG